MEEQNQTPAQAPEKKSNLKNIIILFGAIILILALSAGGFFLFNNLRNNSADTEQANSDEQTTEVSQEPTRTPSTEAIYTCADDKTIQAAFYKEGEFPSATVNLSDGTSALLYQVESASGARYANSDESMVFWNQGNESFVEEAGEKTYINCVEGS